ncbi:MAG: HesA/MoeB/ThiF family protein [Opitutaceae bacterium]
MSYLPRIAESYQGITFSSDELSYYSRHLLLPSVGTSGQQKLKAARVLVVGAGGLGCPVLQALAGAGVGQLTVIDGDAVALSNCARQWLHCVSDAGANKAVSAKDKLVELNPYIRIEAVSEMLSSSNASELIGAHDVVVDATDDLEVRYLIDAVCEDFELPWVHAALYRESSQLCVFWARHGARFKDLFPERSEAPSCAGAGMIGAAASATANLQALEVIKLITGKGQPKLGEVVSIHSGNLQIQSFRLPGVQMPAAPAQDEATAKHALSADMLSQELSIGAAIRKYDLRSERARATTPLSDVEVISAETILETGLPDTDHHKCVLICEEGLVSGLLADALRCRGHQHVFHLQGGVASMPERLRIQ